MHHVLIVMKFKTVFMSVIFNLHTLENKLNKLSLSNFAMNFQPTYF